MYIAYNPNLDELLNLKCSNRIFDSKEQCEQYCKIKEKEYPYLKLTVKQIKVW